MLMDKKNTKFISFKNMNCIFLLLKWYIFMMEILEKEVDKNIRIICNPTT